MFAFLLAWFFSWSMHGASVNHATLDEGWSCVHTVNTLLLNVALGNWLLRFLWYLKKGGK